MPRIARIYLDEGVFHILARGNNKQVIFHDKSDFDYYKASLRKIRKDQPFRLYHWCLMSNHVHMIIEANPKTDLSRMMKRLNLSYYAYYKRKYSYAGHFWQDRFKSLLIDADRYLLACALYIERNPARARLVKSAREYPNSSYNYYAYGHSDHLTDTDPLYKELGRNQLEQQESYRKLTLDTEMRVSQATFNQLFFGGDDFVRKMEKKFGMTNTRLERGRPKTRK